MKQLMLLLSVLALSVCRGLPQDEAMPKNQKAKHFEGKITHSVSADYLLFLPKDYSAKSDKRWPLMLFLHGAGERGTNVAKVSVHGPPKIVKDNADFRFILVSPQCPSGEWWSNDVLIGLLDEITKKYSVDTKRIYLTGLSMGGFGTWNLALAYPERFAAIAPICGGGDPLPLLIASPAKMKLYKQLPVWAFHGGKDDVVKPEESQRMVDAFKKIGNDAKLTIYPEAGHDSWTEAYKTQALYDWFLAHQSDNAGSKAKRK